MGVVINMNNKFAFQFMNLYGIDRNKRAEKLSIAAHQATNAINSEEFELWFLSTVFTQLTDEQKKLTNSELLNIIRQPVFLNYYVVPRPWYKRYSSVIGWTIIKDYFLSPVGQQGVGMVTTYSNQFDGMSVAGLASHITHEAMHCPPYKFSHEYNWSKARDLSLPYQIGFFVEKYINKSSFRT